jgi:hypothetical protein
MLEVILKWWISTRLVHWSLIQKEVKLTASRSEMLLELVAHWDWGPALLGQHTLLVSGLGINRELNGIGILPAPLLSGLVATSAWWFATFTAPTTWTLAAILTRSISSIGVSCIGVGGWVLHFGRLVEKYVGAGMDEKLTVNVRNDETTFIAVCISNQEAEFWGNSVDIAMLRKVGSVSRQKQLGLIPGTTRV